MAPTAPRRRAAWQLTALAAAAMAPSVALAQVELPIDPLEGRFKRDVREIERQAVTDPAGAADRAARTRRDLIDRNGGVGFSPDQRRIDRDLERAQGTAAAEAARRDAAAPDPLVQPPRSDLPASYREEATGGDLPASYDETGGGNLSGVGKEMRLASRLLDRAATGIEERDATQASSDLATAEASLTGLRAASVSEAELAPLAKRLTGLRRELAKLAPSGDAPTQ